MTVAVTTEPWCWLFGEQASPVAQPTVSSLHAIAAPEQVPLRSDRTVSNLVAAPHVWIVAAPDAAGVHWNICSGAVAVADTQPLTALAPAVVPWKVPPAAGITVGAAHVPVGTVVLVVDVVGGVDVVVGGNDMLVEVRVLDVDVEVDVVLVVGGCDVLVDVVGGADVVVGASDVLVDEVEELVLDEDDVDVELVDELVEGATEELVDVVEDVVLEVDDVEEAAGAMTVRLNTPLAPPQDPP